MKGSVWLKLEARVRPVQCRNRRLSPLSHPLVEAFPPVANTIPSSECYLLVQYAAFFFIPLSFFLLFSFFSFIQPSSFPFSPLSLSSVPVFSLSFFFLAPFLDPFIPSFSSLFLEASLCKEARIKS